MIIEFGDVELLFGELVEWFCFEFENWCVVVEGGLFVLGCLELMGIIKVLLVMDLWLLVVLF